MSLLPYAAAFAVALVVFDAAWSVLLLRQPTEVTTRSYASSKQLRTCVVLPGFSNPPAHLAKGMQRIMGQFGPIVVLHHSTTLNFDRIYRALIKELARLKGPRDILVYGMSMGGQLGELFRKRYEHEGSPFGPIRELILDCSPGDRDTLPAPGWAKSAAARLLRFYRGGPLMALIVAAGNYYARIDMPAPLSEGADRELYAHYARGLMWYNNRAWVAQMRFMLEFRLPHTPVHTHTRVIYIGARDASRDKLVLQSKAIPQWLEVHPKLELVTDDAIGHAWPMEQPETYTRLVREIVCGRQRAA